MKKKFLIGLVIFFFVNVSYAADLVEVYAQAQTSDPVFQQAIAKCLAAQEGIPISISALLPNITGTIQPSITRSGFSGSYFQVDGTTGAPLSPRNNTARAYSMILNVNQTIFDFAQFATVAQQRSLAKSASATLNAALQDLMVRTSKAYFAILKDEEDLRYGLATKLAYKEQLSQVRQQYEVGLKTRTELYTAQASYDSAVAKYIAGENKLANDRENLRVITGRYYPKLSYLSDYFPLVIPTPANINAWVIIAERQNWSIKSAQYNVSAARQVINQMGAGHLPTLTATGTMDRLYANNINGYNALTSRNGPGTQTDRSIALTLNIPFFSGGLVVAQTDQAKYNYQLSQQQLEETLRLALNNTRQSYLGILSGISQIKADRQAIKSTKSSLEGMQASYEVGTETLVNVLNQRERVFQAQTDYARDRYDYVINWLTLKQSAGTLSYYDLHAINRWLRPTRYGK